MKIVAALQQSCYERLLERGAGCGIGDVARRIGTFDTPRGLPRFKAHVQSAVLAHNLLRFARLRPKPA